MTANKSKIFGHQRSPSVEWKELTKRDAQHSLGLELDRLLLTAGAGDKERTARDFLGFGKLFDKFLNSTRKTSSL